MGALTIVAKYLIEAAVEIQGLVDKPDIVGALFSQTEGLLGSELDLRNLQNTGRIGRIEVEVEHKGDKTVGKIYIPSNLDRYETSLLAAMLESVDKVGPYNAKVQVLRIGDLREEKRKKIMDRARELLSKIEAETLPDTKEIVERFVDQMKEAELVKYGPEGLPAGPDVDKSDTVIIVEGRADVINLLKHGYRNVIAIEGASGGIPKSVIDLSRKKTVIAFVDGDRGGDLVLRELLKSVDVDYVARAPSGKEVEQLTGKEISKALRNKLPIEEYLLTIEKKERQVIEEAKQEAKEQRQEQAQTAREGKQEAEASGAVEVPVEKREAAPEEIKTEKPHLTPSMQLEVKIPPQVVEEMSKLEGTLEAVIYDENWNMIKRVPVRDLVDALQQVTNAHAIIFDGVCTQRLVDAAASKGVKLMAMSRLGNIAKVPASLQLASIEDILKTMEAEAKPPA
ncbi:DNA primase [Thermocladium modestius]|uniref:DNA primase DnaG n=1 Tax=Thermocladium modestius TaxID=62609 RepID=A0A830GT43_9CREN|nr:DNA primase DnaG [Thermocladium modestius]GGP20005.1 DNA primase [Thermocladium modestius]